MVDSPRSAGFADRSGVAPFSTRFLTPEDLRNVAAFTNDTSDSSLSSRILSPFASRLAKLVPTTLAPNVLTLMSLVSVLHACHTTYLYHESYARFSTTVTIMMFTLYHALDLVDGKHAKNTKNDTPLGYVFSQACDAIGLTFIVITMGMLLGVEDTGLLWYLVNAGHLVFLWAQLSAFNRGYLSWGLFTGPGEAFFVFNAILGLRAIFGLDWLIGWVRKALEFGLTSLGKGEMVILMDKHDLLRLGIQTVYYGLLIGVLLRVVFLPKIHRTTRNYLLFCLCYRSIPGLLTGYGIAKSTSLTEVICDGLFMSIVTSDLVLARMAKREMHDWIFLMAMMSLLDKFLNLFMAVFFYCSIVYDICTFMNLPLFTPVINVYIDGVFDLCHLGHKNHIMRALKYGNRLLVGVMADEDVRKYKRYPIMSLEERCAEVDALRCVYKVIPGAPCFGLTKEFIDEWKIHVVLASEEYNKPEDKYYKVPREMGILRIMPRTDGVSTSDLIKRILQREVSEQTQ